MQWLELSLTKTMQRGRKQKRRPRSGARSFTKHVLAPNAKHRERRHELHVSLIIPRPSVVCRMLLCGLWLDAPLLGGGCHRSRRWHIPAAECFLIPARNHGHPRWLLWIAAALVSGRSIACGGAKPELQSRFCSVDVGPLPWCRCNACRHIQHTLETVFRVLPCVESGDPHRSRFCSLSYRPDFHLVVLPTFSSPTWARSGQRRVSCIRQASRFLKLATEIAVCPAQTARRKLARHRPA